MAANCEELRGEKNHNFNIRESRLGGAIYLSLSPTLQPTIRSFDGSHKLAEEDRKLYAQRFLP